MNQRIVVEAGVGSKWLEGDVLDEVVGAQASGEGDVTLPVDADLLKRSGIGGYFRRSWGRGIVAASGLPSHVVPITMYLSSKHRHIEWAARLGVEEMQAHRYLTELRKGAHVDIDGSLRLAADGSQPSPAQVGVKASGNEGTTLRGLSIRDLESKTVLIRGTAEVFVPQSGYYGLSLYGRAPGFRVMWVAASQIV
jgi:hypothetical protein